MAERQLMLPGEIVKKSNAICRANWSVSSVWEPRLVALVAARVHTNDKDFHEYEIPISEIVQGKQDGQTYRRVTSIVDNLMGRVLTIPDEKGWTKYTLFSKCRLDSERNVLLAGFHPDLKDHFLKLGQYFTQYSLVEFLTLPSTYSQRIFEILSSWNDKPEVTIGLEELHEMLDTPPSLRSKFKDFRRRVLERAHKDIHAHTSLSYEWKPIKVGRKIKKIRFIFAQNRQEVVKKERQEKQKRKQSQKQHEAALEAVKCHQAGQCDPNDSLRCQLCVNLFPPKKAGEKASLKA